jgi:uncharacterized protein YajQ (UPF0234 family)
LGSFWIAGLHDGAGGWEAPYDGLRSPIYGEMITAAAKYYAKTYGENSPQHLASMPSKTSRAHIDRPKIEPRIAELLFNEMVEKEKTLTLFADDEFKVEQVRDVLIGKLTKRGVDIRCLENGDLQKVSGNKSKQVVKVRTGIEAPRAKEIVKLLKDSKMKVQGSIQGDAVRVSGAKRDTLQEAIALVKKSITDYPVQFENFRE